MKRLIYIAFILLFSSLSLTSQSLQSPSEFLGYELGTQFSRHHQIVDYFEYIASNSDRVHYLDYGKTYEGRRLTLAYVSSPKNIVDFEQIRKAHLNRVNGTETDESEVSVVWLSYNVHGNESSSSEASMITLYELITEKADWLENTLVIIDPCINPDGRDRYVNFYNQTKSTPFDVDKNTKEHNEPWPGGRFNHYLFDLNRDWAWGTQVETRQRLKMYHQWYPQIHVDFHEQGINNPYFFAPSAKPLHEVITPFQNKFYKEIGKNNASYFNKENWLYFTKEIFDLLYPGYGDTYPTFLGALGMTYEQAGGGVAGLAVKTKIGDTLTLVDRIKHHKTTGLSTVEVAHLNAKKLNTEFKKYHNDKNGKYKTYAMKGSKKKMKPLIELLKMHEIPYYTPKSVKEITGINYDTKSKIRTSVDKEYLIVKGNDKKTKLVQALFEPDAYLADSLTYDITAWALPYVYGLNAIASNDEVETKPYKEEAPIVNQLKKGAYAYAIEWNSFVDAKFLAQCIQKGIKVKYTLRPMKIEGKNFDRGSLFILRGENKYFENLANELAEIGNRLQVQIKSLETGYAESGPDLGSVRLQPVLTKKVGLVFSPKENPIAYGELWHYFEKQLKFPLTQISIDKLKFENIGSFDVLIFPPTYKSIISKNKQKLIKDWISSGGKAIAIGSGISNFEGQDEFSITKKKIKEKDTLPKPFASLERSNISNFISGSIFKTVVDKTNPLAFGYGSTYYTLKNSSSAYELLTNGYNLAYFKDNAKPISGFGGSKALELQNNSLCIGNERFGNGRVTYFVDDPIYRGFWENGKLWLANSIFF